MEVDTVEANADALEDKASICSYEYHSAVHVNEISLIYQRSKALNASCNIFNTFMP